jgi:glutaredoxin
MTTHIEILAVADCPHVEGARQRCIDASVDLADVDITTTVVSDEDHADRLGMRGSPTILIDGENLFDEPGTATSCSCRVGSDAIPTITAISDALRTSRLGFSDKDESGGSDVVVHRLIGIYHASGTPWGELSYWLKARIGSTHCALCDITHGAVREKAEWQTCRRQLAAPFDTVHLNERDPQLTEFTKNRTPCIVADTSAGLIMVVDAAELAACEGNPSDLIDTIARNSDALGLNLSH